MNNTQFMYAIMALLNRKGLASVDSGDKSLHQAMAAAIEGVGKAKLLAHGVRLCVDPITGTLGELFHTASLLQSYQMARRPNPSYTPLKLRLGENGSTELLRSLEEPDLMLARKFADIVEKRLVETAKQ